MQLFKYLREEKAKEPKKIEEKNYGEILKTSKQHQK